MDQRQDKYGFATKTLKRSRLKETPGNDFKKDLRPKKAVVQDFQAATTENIIYSQSRLPEV